jgi:hypothetical protein
LHPQHRYGKEARLFLAVSDTGNGTPDKNDVFGGYYYADIGTVCEGAPDEKARENGARLGARVAQTALKLST